MVMQRKTHGHEVVFDVTTPMLVFALAAVAVKVAKLDFSNIDTAIDAAPLFVMFHAPWCGHCKRLRPTWVELADTLADSEVTVAGVDATESELLALRFAIGGYPTLIFFPNATHMHEYRGPRSKEALEAFARGSHEETPVVPVPSRYGAIVYNIVAQAPVVYQQMAKDLKTVFSKLDLNLSWQDLGHPAAPALALVLIVLMRMCCCHRSRPSMDPVKKEE